MKSNFIAFALGWIVGIIATITGFRMYGYAFASHGKVEVVVPDLWASVELAIRGSAWTFLGISLLVFIIIVVGWIFDQLLIGKINHRNRL